MVLGKIGIIDKNWNELIFPVGIGILDKDWYSLTGLVFLYYQSNFFSFGIPNKDKTKFKLQIKIGVADKDWNELVYLMRIGILD